MEDRKTLRSLAESLRAELTRGGMPDAEAWEWFIRLAAARALNASEGRIAMDAAGAVRHAARELPALEPMPRGMIAGARRAEVQAAWEVLSGRQDQARVDAALGSATSLGWLHQYWMTADKTLVATKLRKKAGDSIGGEDLIAATCVYTTREHVRFLLENALARVWGRSRSKVRRSWSYVAGKVLPGARSVREITIFDPACGSGHFLVEAMDMLFAMYRVEEPRRSAASICTEVLKRNIFGLDVDGRAVRLARAALAMKCRQLGGRSTRAHVELAASGSLGSLDRPRGRGRSRVERLLARRYSVVAMNPPFVGFRKLATEIKRAIVERDELAASDLAVAFLSRGFELVEEGGMLAAVTPAAWLTSSPAGPLRRHMLDHGGPRVVASLGQRAFETAPLLFVSLAVIERGRRGGDAAMIESKGDLAAAAKRARRVALERIRRDPERSLSPSAAVLPVDRATKFARTGDFFTFADGVWTGDTARDTRSCAEVTRDDPQWVPASGGLGYCRWYGPMVRVLRATAAERWTHLDRREGCLEYSRVAGGRLAARMVFARSAAIAGVVSMLPRDGVEDRRLDVLAVFNSRVGTLWLKSLTSGLNFNPGYAARVPIPGDGFSDRVRGLVREAVGIRRDLVRGMTGCWEPGRAIPASRRLERESRLCDVEREIDLEVASAMGVAARDLDTVALPAQSVFESRVRRGMAGPEVLLESRERARDEGKRPPEAKRAPAGGSFTTGRGNTDSMGI